MLPNQLASHVSRWAGWNSALSCAHLFWQIKNRSGFESKMGWFWAFSALFGIFLKWASGRVLNTRECSKSNPGAAVVSFSVRTAILAFAGAQALYTSALGWKPSTPWGSRPELRGKLRDRRRVAGYQSCLAEDFPKAIVASSGGLFRKPVKTPIMRPTSWGPGAKWLFQKFKK